MNTSGTPVYTRVGVTLTVDDVRVRNVLIAVHQYVRVGVAPDERAELDARNEEGEVVDFGLRVLAVDEAGEVEELRAFGVVVVDAAVS